jgi:hypothetical protein
LVIYIVAIFIFNDAQEVSIALAAVTGTIGTIVGAYFGVQTGAAGKEKAEDAAEEARKELSREEGEGAILGRSSTTRRRLAGPVAIC